MAGLTPNGFEIKRLSDLVQELRNEATLLWQDLVPSGDVVNTDDNSVIGRQINLVSPALADLWEVAEDNYNSFNINAATGVALDNLCALGGVARQPASPTVTSVLLTGSPETTIDVGFKLQDVKSGSYHSLLETVVLNNTNLTKATLSVLTVSNLTAYTIQYRKSPDTLGDGYTLVSITSDADSTQAEILSSLAAAINTVPHNSVLTASVVNNTLVLETLDFTSRVDLLISSNLNIDKVGKPSTASCDTTGPIEIPVNSLTRISVPMIGLDSVTNPLSGIQGTNRETDSELRTRYKLAKFGDGTNLTEALYSAIYAINDVESVIITENDTDVALSAPDPAVPPHSFYIIVLGGASQEIGQAIWNNKPLGIGTYGGEVVTVYDSQGVAKTIKFGRPVAKDIYVSLSITVGDDFAPDGVDLLKTQIASYINSLLIAEDVIYSRLYTPVNSVAGHYVNSMTIGTTPSPVGTSNIPIQYFEKAAISEDNIIISTV